MKIKIFLLFLFLFPFIIISFFNQPSIDDFWSSNTIHNFGRLGAVKHFYESVSGRYFSNFLMSIFNTLSNRQVWIFKIFPVVIIFAFTFSTYFFYSGLLQSFLSKSLIIFLALAYTALHIVNMRSLFEGLYWMSSTICYQLSVIIFLIALGSIIRYIQKPSLLYGFIAIVCCLLLPGTTEIISPVFMFILIILFFSLYKKQKSRRFIAACILIVLCGILVVFLSGGNHARILNDATTYNSGFFIAIFYSLRAVGYYFLLWLINPVNISLLLLLLPQMYKINVYSEFFSSKTFIVVLIMSLFLCAIIYFPLFYFESAIPFPRITTLVFFIGFHLFILILFLVSKQQLSGKKKLFSIIFENKFYKYLWLIFFVALFTSKNFLAVAKDIISGTAYNYNKEANARFNYLKNCKTDTCYIEYYKYWPSSIENFPKENMNTNPFIHIDKYFGKTILYKRKENILKK